MSRVLIFYGSTREARGWGQICADNVHHLENNIADVICRQYGRKGGTFYQLSRWATYNNIITIEVESRLFLLLEEPGYEDSVVSWTRPSYFRSALHRCIASPARTSTVAIQCYRNRRVYSRLRSTEWAIVLSNVCSKYGSVCLLLAHCWCTIQTLELHLRAIVWLSGLDIE